MKWLQVAVTCGQDQAGDALQLVNIMVALWAPVMDLILQQQHKSILDKDLPGQKQPSQMKGTKAALMHLTQVIADTTMSQKGHNSKQIKNAKKPN